MTNKLNNSIALTSIIGTVVLTGTFVIEMFAVLPISSRFILDICVITFICCIAMTAMSRMSLDICLPGSCCKDNKTKKVVSADGENDDHIHLGCD